MKSLRTHLTNEKGYTLLITLGLVMMLMLFMFSFTRIAVSQKVQVEKTDSNIVTTALAEMGAEFYKEEIIRDVNQLIADTATKMDQVKKTSTSYTDLTTNMTALATTQNAELAAYYANTVYMETASTPPSIVAGYTTIVDQQTRGYRLIERSNLNVEDSTLSLKVVGFTETDVSEPIELFIELPEQLMWQGDKTESFITSYTFAQYASLPNNDTIVVTNPINTANGQTYNFEGEHFYYFQQGGTFNHQQFGSEGSLLNVNVLSGASLSFEKHFQVKNSNLITTTLDLEFNSNSQTEIDSSHIIANRIIITKGSTEEQIVNPNNDSQRVDFMNGSTVCLLPDPSISQAAYDLNVSNLKNVLLYKDTSTFVYRKSNGTYYAYTRTGESALSTDFASDPIYQSACNIRMAVEEEKTVFEAYDPNNMRLADVIYQ